LEECINQLRAFAAESNFMAFHAAHAGTFEQMAVGVKELLSRADYITQVERYYGLRQQSYTMILSPLTSGNYGPRVPAPGGQWQIYSINSAFGVKNGIPQFVTDEGLINLIWHEFSHSFVNPLTELHRARVEKTGKLYAPIEKYMRPLAYGSWETAVNEHLVRAVTARLHALHKSAEAGEDLVLHERGLGFAYIEALTRKLAEYEAQRSRYATLADFYPELLKAFEDLASRQLGPEFFNPPFTGPIDAVTLDRAAVVVILPTAERDAAEQAEMHRYIQTMKERFFKDARLLTDQEALAANLSDHSLLVYGTPEGNLFLKALIAQMPVRITTSEVRTGQIHQGTSLRFISAWPHPQNPRRGVTIYTAQRAQEVIGIHSVFHGGTDYVVAAGTTVLEGANYRSKRGRWSFPPK
jgi:hypothetical protein